MPAVYFQIPHSKPDKIEFSILFFVKFVFHLTSQFHVVMKLL